MVKNAQRSETGRSYGLDRLIGRGGFGEVPCAVAVPVKVAGQP